MGTDALTVLSVSPSYPPAHAYGAGRYAAGLHRALGELGHDVHVVTPNYDGAGCEPPQHVRVHGLLHRPPVRHPDGVGDAVLANAWLAARALQLVRSLEHVDLVLAHGWTAGHAGVALAEATSAPLVAVLGSTTPGSVRGDLDPAQRYMAEMEGWLDRAARVVVPSEALAEEFGQVFRDVQRPLVVRPGVWPDEWQVATELRDFRSLFAKPDEPLLLYAGRLIRENGLGLLLDAFTEVRASRPDARLVVAGDGPMASTLQQRAQEHHGDHIRFAGHVDGTVLASLYRVANVMVCPHLYAPTCHAALEALACGLPIVASRVGSLSELEGVAHVPPADPRAVAAAALAALDGARRAPVILDWIVSARQLAALARPRVGRS